VFSLLPPSLLRWLSDASVSPFIMDADERLRFTIVNSSINLLEQWTNGRSTFGVRSARETADHQRRDPSAITDNSVANYGITGNWADDSIVGYGGDFTKYM
jgi:hypothetical protein